MSKHAKGNEEKVKSLKAKIDRVTKTNHKTGWHRPIKNPTTNYPMDSHQAFCKRCLTYNGGCPLGTYKCSV